MAPPLGEKCVESFCCPSLAFAVDFAGGVGAHLVEHFDAAGVQVGERDFLSAATFLTAST